MANEKEQLPPLLPPEPWYASPVQLNLVIGALSQIASIILRILARYFKFEFSDQDLQLLFADITQGAAIIFAVVAIVKRGKSTIQPLTLTKAGAVAKSETSLIDPTTMSLKTEGAAALAAGQLAGTQPDSAEAKKQGG